MQITHFKKMFRKYGSIYRKTSMLESFFNNVLVSIKKRLRHRCFLLNIAKFLRTPILKNVLKKKMLEVSEI